MKLEGFDDLKKWHTFNFFFVIVETVHILYTLLVLSGLFSCCHLAGF